jgi:mRNA-degrading endonuclease YafQ of YafQ-DinJ toxin-antitoxin module
MEIYYASSFTRASKKLSADIKAKADSAIEIFKNNPDDMRLRVHKLHGRFCNYWAFSVDFRYRIIFRYGQTDEVILMSIGDHRIYD